MFTTFRGVNKEGGGVVLSPVQLPANAKQILMSRCPLSECLQWMEHQFNCCEISVANFVKLKFVSHLYEPGFNRKDNMNMSSC